jgi:hypothetical protein
MKEFLRSAALFQPPILFQRRKIHRTALLEGHFSYLRQACMLYAMEWSLYHRKQLGRRDLLICNAGIAALIW